MRKLFLAALLGLLVPSIVFAIRLNPDKFEQLTVISGMMIQNSYLVYNDIYNYTKPGITLYGGKEANPLAAAFWKSGNWNLGYAAAIAAQVAGNILAYRLEPSGTLNWMLNLSIAVAEMTVISMWKYDRLPVIDLKITALILKF